jgi:hypothetical protein
VLRGTRGTRGRSAAGLAILELEEIVERLPRVVNLGRRGLAFHRRPGLVERAPVASALGRDPRGYRLHAFESAPRIERRALGAAVQLGATSGAPCLEPDLTLDHRTALRAPDHLPEPRHVDVARAVLGNSPRPCRCAWLRRRPRCRRLLRTIAVVILIAAQTIFSVAHVRGSTAAAILCDGPTGRKRTCPGPTYVMRKLGRLIACSFFHNMVQTLVGNRAHLPLLGVSLTQ